jgi:hypothetical protein
MTAIPELGPLYPGGKSVLDMKMTHDTSGIAGYPAYDDAFSAGLDVLAPEDLKVTKASSSNPGDAFYATGTSSGIKYWFGHLVAAPAVGKQFKKGAKMGDVMQTSQGGGSHVHIGMDVRPLTGQSLKYGTNGNGPDYTYYPKTNREQLEAMLGGEEDGVYPWLEDWIEWDLQGQYHDPPEPRPAGVPKDIPDDAWPMRNTTAAMLKRQGSHKCFEQWMAWKDDGEQGPKPSCAEEYPRIPEEWQEARARLR